MAIKSPELADKNACPTCRGRAETTMTLGCIAGHLILGPAGHLAKQLRSTENND